ncbi:hypothetical protein L3X38_009452 [Prunus dulcis]|uniref:Reverse transcriptase Ty1/copia-type domain-containing protein n=1 Tax=Prunus dulcis TaxID=3755 RepID=A0AAD4WFU1_PRUDU|nr:hypothetical protein L3X38_009452 [Prunus dulcis]
MFVPYHLWGHVVRSVAYLINCIPSWVLDLKTQHDVFGNHVSPVLVSKLPAKVFGCVTYVHVYSHQRSKLDHCALRCVFIGYSSTHKGYMCYYPSAQKVYVTLDVTFHKEVSYYVSPSSPIQGERGSELESLELENLGLEFENYVFEDKALGKEMTALKNDWSPISGDKACALGVETIGRIEANDQSPVSENSDNDSCTYEVDAIPSSALPVPQSTRDIESSELLTATGPYYNSMSKMRFYMATFKEVIYMDLPPSIPITSKEGVVCKLRKSLYELKQSPKAWFERFATSMKKFGYVQSNLDHTLFLKRHKGKLTALIIYVDDMIVTGDDQAEMQNLQKYLASEFEIKSLGDLKYFLGIEVARSKYGIFLSQRKYILDLLVETGMLDSKPIDTPSE